MPRFTTYLFIALALCSWLALAQAGDISARFARKLAAAEQGDPGAQYKVGFMYEKGKDTDEDPEAAFSWYLKAARQGLDKAQYKTGYFYLKGIGTDPDPEQALRWLTASAEQGFAAAQYQLGKYYAGQRPLRRNTYDSARHWLTAARDNGFAPASERLHELERDYAAHIARQRQLARAREKARKAVEKHSPQSRVSTTPETRPVGS